MALTLAEIAALGNLRSPKTIAALKFLAKDARSQVVAATTLSLQRLETSSQGQIAPQNEELTQELN